LKSRTKAFAVRILKLTEALPEPRSGRIIANQLGRSGTSVGANYRAACRAKSAADRATELSIVEEAAGESAFWLEVIPAADLLPEAKIAALRKEADELTAIAVASRQTLLRNNRKSKF